MGTDIKNRIKKDFGSKSIKAFNLLNKFEEEYDLSDRISRCIVHLSQGNINKLKANIKLAERDWRDIVDMAEEYNLEFNKPFSD